MFTHVFVAERNGVEVPEDLIVVGASTVGGAAADANVITILPVSDFASILIRTGIRP